jgi:hypothetical protein
MKTTVLTDADTLFEQLEALFEWAESVDLCYAWACSTGGTGRHWKAMNLAKVRRAVIGTSFARTEPAAIVALNGRPDRLKLIIKSDGTFHPKVIMGRKGDLRRAIVGSANFTRGAFTTNTELSIELDGTKSDAELKHIQKFINDRWDDGEVLDDDWLIDYKALWERERKRKVMVPGAPLEITSLTSLEMTWPEYVELIRKQEGRLTKNFKIKVSAATESYFWEIGTAAKIFRQAPRFSDLSPDDRTFLMGKGGSTGLLGSMGGAGWAMELVQRYPEKIGRGLDQLPLDGDVAPALALKVLAALTELHGVSVGVASRLMTIKRPDLFISVNNGSEPKLSMARNGVRIKDKKHYMLLLNSIWNTEWFRSPRPADAAEAALWDWRVALLDSTLYEHRDGQ